ncbi:Uncharacterised protein (plasmid) [Mycoplasmopsis gallopavonis]|uniref:Lipoprotein n=2 Tax=Mycoplasmopsis gallopavonis TaxID=76629 RepID=A0A449B0L6_9BACT|nr:Uncharacterised protein [Mycoplasmopsis gallopavonis]
MRKMKKFTLLFSSALVSAALPFSLVSCLRSEDKTVQYAQEYFSNNPYQRRPKLTKTNSNYHISNLIKFENDLYNSNILTYTLSTFNFNLKGDHLVNNDHLKRGSSGLFTNSNQTINKIVVPQVKLNEQKIEEIARVTQNPIWKDPARSDLILTTVKINQDLSNYFTYTPEFLGYKNLKQVVDGIKNSANWEAFSANFGTNDVKLVRDLHEAYDYIKAAANQEGLIKSYNPSDYESYFDLTKSAAAWGSYELGVVKIKDLLINIFQNLQAPKVSFKNIQINNFDIEKKWNATPINIYNNLKKLVKFTYWDLSNSNQVITYQKVYDVVANYLNNTPFGWYFKQNDVFENGQFVRNNLIIEDTTTKSFTFNFNYNRPYNGIPTKEFQLAEQKVLAALKLNSLNMALVDQSPTLALQAVFDFYSQYEYKINPDSQNGITSGFGPTYLLVSQNPVFTLSSKSDEFRLFDNPILPKLTLNEWMSNSDPASGNIRVHYQTFLIETLDLVLQAQRILDYDKIQDPEFSQELNSYYSTLTSTGINVENSANRQLLWEIRENLNRKIKQFANIDESFDYQIEEAYVEALSSEFLAHSVKFVENFPDLIYLSSYANFKFNVRDKRKKLTDAQVKLSENEAKLKNLQLSNQANEKEIQSLQTQIERNRRTVEKNQREYSNAYFWARAYEVLLNKLRPAANAYRAELLKYLSGSIDQNAFDLAEQKYHQAVEDFKAAKALTKESLGNPNLSDQDLESYKASMSTLIAADLARANGLILVHSNSSSASYEAGVELFTKTLFGLGVSKIGSVKVIKNDKPYYFLVFENEKGEQKYLDVLKLFKDTSNPDKAIDKTFKLLDQLP